MKQLESTFKNMTIVLLLVCAVSSAAVAYVYEMTRAPKQATDLAKKITALKEILPEFDNNPVAEGFSITQGEKEFKCYPAKKSGEPVGTAILVESNQGYGGKIRLLVGFLPNGSIYNWTVLEHHETPGLGDKIERNKSEFSMQFKQKNPAVFRLRVKKDGGDVDGITAATISSRAVCDALRQAYDVYSQEAKK